MAAAAAATVAAGPNGPNLPCEVNLHRVNLLYGAANVLYVFRREEGQHPNK